MNRAGLLARSRSRAPRGSGAILGTLVVLSVGAYVVTATFDPSELWATARAADVRLLALAGLVYLASWPLRGWRYAAILRGMGHRQGLGFTTATIFISQTVNLLVPARAGDGVRAVLFKERQAVPYAVGVSSLAVERVFDLLVIALLGGIGVLGTLAMGAAVPGAGAAGNLGWVAIGTACVVVGITILAAVVLRRDARPAARLQTWFQGTRGERLGDAIARSWAAVSRLATDRRTLGRTAGSSAVIWLLDVVTAALVVTAVAGSTNLTAGEPTVFVAVTIAVSVGNLAKAVPATQGGIGLYEAAFTGVLVALLPVAAGIALIAAVMDHALKNVVTISGGVLAAGHLGAALDRPPDPTDG